MGRLLIAFLFGMIASKNSDTIKINGAKLGSKLYKKFEEYGDNQ